MIAFSRFFMGFIGLVFWAALAQQAVADEDKDYSLKDIPIKNIHNGKNEKKIYIVIVGDGYIKQDLAPDKKYEKDCRRT